MSAQQLQLSLLRGAVSVVALASLVAWEMWAPFFPGRTGWLRHGARNVCLGLLNALLVLAVFSGALAGVSGWTAEQRFGLVYWLGLSDAGGLVAYTRAKLLAKK